MEKNSGNLNSASLLQTGPTNGCRAFTLTELGVVIGIIALLAATLLPALAQSQTKSQAVVCLSNMGQLQRGALLYSSDNNDLTPVNVSLTPQNGGDSTTGRPCWVDGTFSMAAAGDNPAGCSTNPFYLGVNGTTGFGVTLIGSIGPYVKSAGAYHCPADRSIDPTYKVPRVRSCSANMMIGSDLRDINLPPVARSYKIFRKYSDFGPVLDPSQCFEFLEENPHSLNDGWFEYYPDGSAINDRPALNHYRATSFSFADGHAALHQWQDKFLTYSSSGQGLDTLWLAQHGTYKTQ